MTSYPPLFYFVSKHNEKLIGGNTFVILHKMKNMFVAYKYLSIKTLVILEFLLRNQTQLKRVFEDSGSYYGEKLNKILLSDPADAKVI